jgi:hypothetical protein
LLEQHLSSIKNDYGDNIEKINGHALIFKDFVQATIDKIPSKNRPELIQQMLINLDSRFADLNTQITETVENARNNFQSECVFIKSSRKSGTPWHQTAWSILETKLMVTVKSGKSWDPVSALETWRDTIEPRIVKTITESEKLLADTKLELRSHIEDCELVVETSAVVQKLRVGLKAEGVVSGNYMGKVEGSISRHLFLRDHSKQKFETLNKLVESVEDIRRDVSTYGVYLKCFVSEKGDFGKDVCTLGFAEWQKGRSAASSVDDVSIKAKKPKGGRKSITKRSPVLETAQDFSALIEESRSSCRASIAQVCEVYHNVTYLPSHITKISLCQSNPKRSPRPWTCLFNLSTRNLLVSNFRASQNEEHGSMHSFLQ